MLRRWKPSVLMAVFLLLNFVSHLSAQEWGSPVVSQSPPATAVRLPAVTPVTQAQVTALEARLFELEQKLELKEKEEQDKGY